MRADWITVAVRTNLKNKGPMGISMLMVPGDAMGLSRSPLKKMGWLCSDTAHLRFDGVRVPAANLVGEEGAGFKMILTNFNGERLSMAAMALGFSECCYDEALAWAQQRKTFAWYRVRAHLPRGQGHDDWRRCRRDHERVGQPSTRPVKMPYAQNTCAHHFR